MSVLETLTLLTLVIAAVSLLAPGRPPNLLYYSRSILTCQAVPSGGAVFYFRRGLLRPCRWSWARRKLIRRPPVSSPQGGTAGIPPPPR